MSGFHRQFQAVPAAALIVLLSGLAAHAQTQNTAISLSNCSGGGGDDGLTGTCTVSPFGSMALRIGVAPVAKGSHDYTVTFAFSSGSDSFGALDSDQPGIAGQNFGDVNGTANITGGSGKFAGASGSFTYNLAGSGTYQSQAFVLSGTGTLTLPDMQTQQIVGFQVSQNQVTINTQQQQIQGSLSIPIVVWNKQNTQDRSFQVDHTGQVYVETDDFAGWVDVEPASGTIPAGSSTTLTVSANPNGLAPGTYPGTVTITSSPASDGQVRPARPMGSAAPNQSSSTITQTINLTLIVTSDQPSLAISQSGLRFLGVAASGKVPPAQSAVVSSTGSSPIPFSANVSTLTGGNWLSVTPSSATISSTNPSTVNITVNPAGLQGGTTYFGRVDVVAQDAGNSPQSVEVALSVLTPTVIPSVQIAPTGLLFASVAGSTPPAQTIEVSNPSFQTFSISTSIAYENGANWLTVTPSSASASAGQTVDLPVSVNPAGLAPGIYNAELSIVSLTLGTYLTQTVSVVLSVASQSGPAVTARRDATGSASCTPTQLLAVFTQLSGNFQATAGLPVPLQAQVMDDCGTPQNTGTVAASPSTSDPSVTMMPIGSGQWAGTWLPSTAAGGAATVTLFADSASATLAGTAQVSGTLAANATIPIVSPGGVVSAASYAANSPLAPGSFISIFGSNIATGLNSSTKLPLASSLAGTQVVLGGQVLPLQFVSPNQINAIVPYDTPVNASLQLSIQQNGSASLPETVIVGAAQPSVFTQDLSGSGAGIIVDVKPDGTQFEITAANPAAPGDALVIYCAGLGAVSPAVPAGSAAPSTTLTYTVNPVTVTVGGQSAHVLFSGLAPGYSGLYQVNAVVPSGIAAGTDVPVILTVAGISSPPVTISVSQ